MSAKKKLTILGTVSAQTAARGTNPPVQNHNLPQNQNPTPPTPPTRPTTPANSSVAKKDWRKEYPTGSFLLNLLMASVITGGICFLVFWGLSYFHFLSNHEMEFWFKLGVSLALVVLTFIFLDRLTPDRAQFSRAIPFAIMIIFLVVVLYHYGIEEPGKLDKVIDEIVDTEPNQSVLLALQNCVYPVVKDTTFEIKDGQQSPWLLIPENYVYTVSPEIGGYTIYFKDNTTMKVAPGENPKFPKLAKTIFRISPDKGQKFTISAGPKKVV